MTYAVAWFSKTGEKRIYHDTEEAAVAHEAQLRRDAVVSVVAYWCGLDVREEQGPGATT